LGLAVLKMNQTALLAAKDDDQVVRTLKAYFSSLDDHLPEHGVRRRTAATTRWADSEPRGLTSFGPRVLVLLGRAALSEVMSLALKGFGNLRMRTIHELRDRHRLTYAARFSRGWIRTRAYECLTQMWCEASLDNFGGDSVVHNMEDINRKSQIRAVEDEVSLSQIELGASMQLPRLYGYDRCSDLSVY